MATRTEPPPKLDLRPQSVHSRHHDDAVPAALVFLHRPGPITFIGRLAPSLHPGYVAVKKAFGVSTGMAQLTMSLAMLSMAFFTVAYGGLSTASGASACSWRAGAVYLRRRQLHGRANMPMLLAGASCREPGRGAASCWRAHRPRRLRPGSRCPGDRLSHRRLRVGAMVAPPIGGQLTTMFGWRALFVLASAVGLL